MQSRRNQLKNIPVTQAEHPGLWFDKYLRQQLKKDEKVEGTTPQRKLVEECSEIKESEIYQAFFERWQAALALFGAKTKEAEVKGRLAVGLGDESVIETAVTLHHTYGTPYIPGSALKGLAANFAHQRLEDPTWKKDGEAHQILFGSTKEAGFITFFDALYVPDSGHNGQALYPDVITVHHQEYYQSGQSVPADWDNPNPVSFLSTTGRYLIALAGPDDEWIDRVFRILGQALQDVGIGAKTSSGYGRLHFNPPLGVIDSTAGAETVVKQHPEVERFKQQLAAMPIAKVASEIPAVAARWHELEIDKPNCQEIARAILAKVREAKREDKSREKAWYKELLASLPESTQD